MITCKLMDIDNPCSSLIFPSGGITPSTDWAEYLARFPENERPYMEAARKYVEDNGMVGMTGDEFDGKWFAFSDGTALAFTWRSFGDFMQSIVGKREGYMRYYS